VSQVIKRPSRKLSRNDQTCLQWSHQTTMYAACMTQRQNAGLWPTNFPCPVLDLRLTGDHFLCG